MSSFFDILLPVVLFITAAKLIDRYDLNVIVAALFAVIPPFIYKVALQMILLNGYHQSVAGAFTFVNIITTILQFFACLFVFWKLKYDAADEVAAWVGWTIGGGIVIIFVIPALVAVFAR